MVPDRFLFLKIKYDSEILEQDKQTTKTSKKLHVKWNSKLIV